MPVIPSVTDPLPRKGAEPLRRSNVRIKDLEEARITVRKRARPAGQIPRPSYDNTGVRAGESSGNISAERTGADLAIELIAIGKGVGEGAKSPMLRIDDEDATGTRRRLPCRDIFGNPLVSGFPRATCLADGRSERFILLPPCPWTPPGV